MAERHVADTIAAVATAAGAAGLAVVRISGPDALAIGRALAGDRTLADDPRSHVARAATLRCPLTGALLDRGLLLPMLAPHSYTGEDVVELQVHGGAYVAHRVARACCDAGARPAAAGEFTRRAFLNGRLSLDQAEAVADLIHAEDELSARAALAQLRGGLRDEISRLEAPLLALLAQLEGGLEFEEHEDASPHRESVVAKLDVALAHVATLLADADAGRRVRNGVHVVLLGAPNAGKSSLFNALLGDERALVDAEPGTTRDVVDARLVVDGVTFVLHDTAGLRDAGGRVESLGIERARATAAGADVVLQVVDLADEDVTPASPSDVTTLTVGAKSDLATDARRVAARDAGAAITSARTGDGIDDLRRALLAAVDADHLRETAAQGTALNERHRHRLGEANRELAELRSAAATGAPDEVLGSLLAGILSGLGEVSGRVFTEDLLGAIFSRFCVGK